MCSIEGIPIWSAEMLLDFVRARDTSRFDNLAWSDNSFQFDFATGKSGMDLTLMIPVDWLEKRPMCIEADGHPINWTLEEIKGLEYAMFCLLRLLYLVNPVAVSLRSL